ncbi:insulin-induced protein-domain-containing protein [Scheffersomyces xylosifermentans]|uniref:insulin-induced protein-domain-containing protein n=1 Tax=Scheffersomyces xylosifermentans TaxID=1304137 RepID=UPI00315D4617
MTSSAVNSGASTPRMEKSDSVVNLTKPSLYGIYNDDSLLNLSKDINESDIEINMIKSDSVSSTNSESTATSESSGRRESKSMAKLPIFIKILILSSSAFIYNEITKHINYNHFGGNQLANFPLTITNVFVFSLLEKLKLGHYVPIQGEFIEVADLVFALTVQGLTMSLVHPVMDLVLPNNFSKRLLSSNPYPHASTSYSNLFNDLLRASITFLGISYAIRKIEWSSFLQVSIIWSLMNPGLWLLLDGTLSGFVSSLVVSAGACVLVYFDNYALVNEYFNHEQENSIAIWLWVSSFFFCGLIIFGKIGRGLFGNFQSLNR